MALPPLKNNILGPYSGRRKHRSTWTISGHVSVLVTVIWTRPACLFAYSISSSEDRSIESENESSLRFLGDNDIYRSCCFSLVCLILFFNEKKKRPNLFFGVERILPPSLPTLETYVNLRKTIPKKGSRREWLPPWWSLSKREYKHILTTVTHTNKTKKKSHHKKDGWFHWPSQWS